MKSQSRSSTCDNPGGHSTAHSLKQILEIYANTWEQWQGSVAVKGVKHTKRQTVKVPHTPPKVHTGNQDTLCSLFCK